MKHLFVPYELALLAKEKGFDEPCFTNFNRNKNFDTRLTSDVGFCDCANRNLHKGCISAPIYQQLVDWFREERKIEVVVLSNTHTCSKDIKWEWSLYSLTNKKIIKHPVLNVPSYYQALTAALTEAFKLINP